MSTTSVMPKRIQRRRTKGWRMPEGAVSVTRPGKYGNPFVIGGYYMRGDFRGVSGPFGLLYTATTKEHADERYTLIKNAAEAVEWFRWYCGVAGKTFPELRGKDLACWCPLLNPDGKPHPCHADVLLAISNGGE